MNQCPNCGATFPESQSFCTSCGTKLVASQTKPAPEPAPKPAAKRSKVLLIITAVIAVAAIIAAGWFYTLYVDASWDLGTANADLNRAKNEASEAQSELDRVKSEMSEAQSELDRVMAEMSEARSELDGARAEMSEAQSKLEKLDDLVGVYGHGSDNFYAYKSVVVLRRSGKKTIKIYANLDGTVYWHNSDSGITCEWIKEWSNHTTQITFTGNSAGFYPVKFTNDQNSDSFEVLVIVRG